MSSKLPSNVTRMGDATVIRDEDASNPVAVRFDHVTKQYKLFKNCLLYTSPSPRDS